MQDDWPLMTIAECASDEPYSTQIGPFGKALTPEAYRADGVPLLRGVNVNSGRFHDDDFVFISDEDADRLAKFESFPDDVLLVHKGTLGRIGLMPRSRRYPRYIMGNSMLRVRCNPSKLLPEYLHYWLSSPWGQSYLLGRVSQVGVPQIQQPLTTLRQAVLPVPSISTQYTITAILGGLDDKIEQNQRTVKALERLARAIFRAWFVDFEPVKAKAAGATSFPSMPQAIFDELSNKFTDLDQGSLPAGWSFSRLSELCTLVGGGTPRRSEPEYWSGDIPWFSVRDARADTAWVLNTEEHVSVAGIANSAARLLPEGGTIISARGTVGKLAMAGVPMAFNQSCYGVLPNDGHAFVYTHLLLQRAVIDLQQRAHGSVFETITLSTFDGLSMPSPPADLVTAFEKVVSAYFELSKALDQESVTLAGIRDYLIPLLLSGRVSMSPER